MYLMFQTLHVTEFLNDILNFFLACKFSCAAVVKVNEDQKGFEFYGEPRLWDGITIWRKIGGNSSLYILEDEVTICFNPFTVYVLRLACRSGW